MARFRSNIKIPGYENYVVTLDGNIYNDKRKHKKPLKFWLNWNGYYLVELRGKKFAVHRLVALAYHGPCPLGLECAHLDGNRTNNNPENLMYVTRKENHGHKKLHGTHQCGERGPMAKLKVIDIIDIRAKRALGLKLNVIASIYAVSASTISSICNKKTWITVSEVTSPVSASQPQPDSPHGATSQSP